MTWKSWVVSGLIVAAGIGGSQTLHRVDQDLRVLYADHTLATAHLGHVTAHLIRYRTSVIRAIEADTPESYRDIAASLPAIRERVIQPIEQMMTAVASLPSRSSDLSAELAELQAVQGRIRDYMRSADRTIHLLDQRWQAVDGMEAARLRDQAEENAEDISATKFIAITLEMDRLLERVAGLAEVARDEAEGQLRVMGITVLVVSVLLAGAVLFFP